MDVVLLANDLMVASRLQTAASKIDGKIRIATTGSQVVDLCEQEKIGMVIIDLATPGLKLDFVQQLKSKSAKGPRIVAFGPHVHKDRLAAARDAGCDAVISRGQFFGEIESILENEAS
jgi:DNA-binding NarL/FixJ family response regulator